MEPMKKLIFIDNDNEKRAKEDVDSVKTKLDLWAKLPSEYVETIEILPNFGHMDKDAMMSLIFSGENCICSWSMYTANHYSSLFQLTSMLRAAGSNDVRNIVYIDCSGMLSKALERELRNDRKDAMQILNAIETNYIITFDNKSYTDGCFRIRVDLKGVYESPFKKEDINLLELLKK